MKNKILSVLLIGVTILGLTGCGNNDFMPDNNKVEESENITSDIVADVQTISIENGKLTLPNFEKIILNQSTNETTRKKLKTSKLIFKNSKDEELEVVDNTITVPNEDDTITAIYTEDNKEFKTTFAIKSEKKYLTFGNSVLKYGKYNAEGDLPSDFIAKITINSDGSATYSGRKFTSSGTISKVDLKGTWEVKPESIFGLQGSPDNPSAVDGISFTWSDGSSDAYGVGTEYFGNQFMGYRWISE